MIRFSNNRLSGTLCAVTAGVLWGFVPAYIYLFGDADPMKIVGHRSLWSLALLFGLVALRRQMRLVCQIFCNGKLLFGFVISTFFLSANWMVFVYAVQSENVASAALGYFIYPICTVLLGIFVLDERMDRWAWLALTCVAFGVLSKTLLLADIPWIAIFVAGTFSFYAVTRKRIGVDPIIGLFIETLLLLPATIGFFGWLAWSGESIFFSGGIAFVGLAIFLGVVTVGPLILFHAGNQLLSITTASLLFYINPTTQLILATMVFSEHFTAQDLLTFGPIWLGIIIYSTTRRKPVSTSLPASY